MHALSSGSPLTLASLKALVEVYIARNDARIEKLIADRRPGRPKQPELLDLEEKRRVDSKEFDSGMGTSTLPHLWQQPSEKRPGQIKMRCQEKRGIGTAIVSVIQTSLGVCGKGL